MKKQCFARALDNGPAKFQQLILTTEFELVGLRSGADLEHRINGVIIWDPHKIIVDY